MAPRERKPALAALAVLLILVGALGATVMVMRAGNKIEVVVINDNIAAGQPIPMSALKDVEISDVKGIQFIRWGQRNDLTKNYRAATNLMPGTVLTLNQLTKGQNGLTSGKSIVGLSLKDGQFPDGLKAGDTVAAYRVGNDVSKSSSGSSDGSSGDSLGGDTSLISGSVIVQNVKGSSGDFSSGNTSVKVLVDSSVAGKLTIAASAGDVALVLVSGKN
ncbi:MAG: hypothetical protein FWE15_00320 [Actinomycetia bacterium]|nr:hypothetical protein [Actinomycetes bacterium]MCL2728449.1 hypothetical protein [Actinomycetes bacterium]